MNWIARTRVAPFALALALPLGMARGQGFSSSTIPTVPDSYGLAISDDNRTLYAASGHGVVSVIDTATNRFVDSIDLVGLAPHPTGIAYCNRKLYVESYDDIIVVDADARSVLGVIPQPFVAGQNIGDVAVTPDGLNVCAVAGSSYALSIIDPERDIVVGSVVIGRSHTDLSISPDGDRAYALNSNDGLLTIVDLANQQVVDTRDFTQGLPYLNISVETAVGSNGTLYVAWVDSLYHGRISVLDPDGTVRRVFSLPGYSTGVAVSLDDRYLMTGGGYVVDATQGTLVASVSAVPGLSRVVFGTSGERAYLSNNNLQYITAVAGFEPSLSLTGAPSWGSTVDLRLLARGQEGQLYQVVAACTATTGTLLPDGRQFPLDRDAIFRTSALGQSSAFMNFSGFIGSNARATASIRISSGIPGKTIGETFYVCFATFRANRRIPSHIEMISNVLPITILP